MDGCKHDPFKFAIIVSGFEPQDSGKLAWYVNRYPVLENTSINETSSVHGSENDVVNHREDNIKEPRYLYGVQGASMHVIGRNDVIIQPERSEGLLKHYTYKKPLTLYHDGGHYLPSNAASRQAYKTFVQSFAFSQPSSGGSRSQARHS
ncbi:hypothetical protein BGX31_006137 [Mortierella sp. GBA43]|nr:hypothetical protein BGX31_006137 [Mortierella sp. GBA43]